MSVDINIWGNATWYLFHALAHKIKDTDFLELKNDLIYVFKNTCSILPCPDCKHDAITQIEKIKFENITTKEQFKLLIFNFHNHINKKLNKPIYEIDKLDEKYSKANINNIYKNFLTIYSMNANVPQLMSSSFHRQHTLPKIKTSIDKILSKIN